MFDMTAGDARHLPRHPAVPLLVSTTLQTALVGLVVLVPLLVVSDAMPEVPRVMAFVAAPPAPAPPPPPPPSAPATRNPVRQPTAAAPQASLNAAPVEAPSHIEPESVVAAGAGVEGGVEGGIPGGVPGGVLAGVLGSTVPSPPPPPVRHAPLRIGGDIKPPALLHRVEPKYPDFAVQARVEGVVILEAEVDAAGQVIEVRVLRSAGILDRFAAEAVKQWRYSPVLMNGHPEPFLLTVTLSFSLRRPGAVLPGAGGAE
jgi:protein TonB